MKVQIQSDKFSTEKNISHFCVCKLQENHRDLECVHQRMNLDLFSLHAEERNPCICNFTFSALSDIHFVANSLSTKVENCKAQTLGSVDTKIGDKDLVFLTMA